MDSSINYSASSTEASSYFIRAISSSISFFDMKRLLVIGFGTDVSCFVSGANCSLLGLAESVRSWFLSSRIEDLRKDEGGRAGTVGDFKAEEGCDCLGNSTRPLDWDR